MYRFRAPTAVAVAMLLLVACQPGASSSSEPGSEPPASVAASEAESPAPTEPAALFPVEAFAAISEAPVTEELATRFQTALDDRDFGEGWGMSATVMTAEGTWSGAAGMADGVREVGVDDQFFIASITKSVVAAQVMQMVEAGELGLDDPVADHLPPDLQFDTNEATIRQLLSHRSGLPDYYDLLQESVQRTELQRVWTSAEILELLPTDRTPPGEDFAYTETNYLLLGLVIEHLRGRPLGDVLRDGVLAIDGLDRLVHPPGERPTEPIAMPGGDANVSLEDRGGYIPSLANATAFGASGAIASDSLALARWWRAFCAGEIVSQASLTEMSAFGQGDMFSGAYGLGLNNPVYGYSNDPVYGYARAVGNIGEIPGYMSLAACLLEDEAVLVVLTNRLLNDNQTAFLEGLGPPLINVLRSD